MKEIDSFHSTGTPVQRYALAIGIFLITLSFCFLLLPVESGVAFITFYPATVIGFYVCGKGPGALLAVLSAVAGYYFFISPFIKSEYEFELFIGLGIFWGSVYLISRIIERQQHLVTQLKVAKRRYRAILEDQTEIICRHKADGTLIYVNDAFCHLFNRPQSVLIGQKWHPYAWHEDLAMIQEKLSTLSPTNPVVTIENRVITPGRGIRWGQFVNRAFFDQAGQLIEIQAVGRDITEQKQAEEQLAQTMTELQDLYDQAPCGYHSLGPDGTFLRINATELAWLGCRRDEVIGKMKPSDFLMPADKALFEQSFPQFVSNGHIEHLNFDLVGKEGKVRSIDLTATAIRDKAGNFVMSRSVLYDITERKQAEQQIRKLAQAVEQSSESIVITNLDAKIEYVNDAFLRTSGYRREEVMGQNPRFLKSGKTPKETYVSLWDALSHGQNWKGEFINKRKDGREYVELAKMTPLCQPDGRITHYVDVKEDITEKKRMAAELEQYRQQLEERVVERTMELKAALVLAETSNKAKSAFLTNMSHEIRTPMNAIIGMVHLLQKNTPSPKQRKRLEIIDNASQHLLSIINGILDFSKIEAGQMELEQKDFALDILLDQLYSLMVLQAHDKGITITVEPPAVPNWLRGDPVRLNQALINYVANAIKFTDQGTIWIRAKLLAETDIGLQLRFEVQDTGIGILAEKLPMLFKAFTQVDDSITRPYEGTGLGLAITRCLANLMGGDAGVESVLGQGSLFWFTAQLQRGHSSLPDISLHQ